MLRFCGRPQQIWQAAAREFLGSFGTNTPLVSYPRLKPRAAFLGHLAAKRPGGPQGSSPVRQGREARASRCRFRRSEGPARRKARCRRESVGPPGLEPTVFIFSDTPTSRSGLFLDGPPGLRELTIKHSMMFAEPGVNAGPKRQSLVNEAQSFGGGFLFDPVGPVGVAGHAGEACLRPLARKGRK